MCHNDVLIATTNCYYYDVFAYTFCWIALLNSHKKRGLVSCVYFSQCLIPAIYEYTLLDHNQILYSNIPMLHHLDADSIKEYITKIKNKRILIFAHEFISCNFMTAWKDTFLIIFSNFFMTFFIFLVFLGTTKMHFYGRLDLQHTQNRQKLKNTSKDNDV